MPYSAGSYTLYTPGNPAVALQTITASLWNSTFGDIATALSTCLLKDGTQTVTANLPLASFKLTQVGGILYTVGSGLTAIGTTQTDAYALVYAVNEFTTVATDTGAVLPSSSTGMSITVYNGGANPLKLYPNSGATINGLASNAAMLLQKNTAVTFTCVSATRWIGILSA